MCGITGFFEIVRRMNSNDAHSIISNMTDRLIHRGPNDKGIWVDTETGLALGHRRLSILDLSREGHQPKFSACGRYIVVYNGEIYNFLELRTELESLGHSFYGNSDTEVLLASFTEWGVEASLKKFNGMFSFGLWDLKERILYLARDRFGKKPLYYGQSQNSFMFASELKALHCHPDFVAKIDMQALSLYLRYAYIPTPYCIYSGFSKLVPGTYITVNLSKKNEINISPPISYWNPIERAIQCKNNSFGGTEQEAMETMEELLMDSVRIRMISDVPLGVFLSGGVDSSLVTALMQAQSQDPIKTFSIGFHEQAYNEAQDAKRVANHLGTDHTELYVTDKEAMTVIERLPELYDEPFADSSQIPTFLVSQMSQKHVTVVLSGDGGDEIFGGYNRHIWIPKITHILEKIPFTARRLIAKGLNSTSPLRWKRLLDKLNILLPDFLKHRNQGEKIQKISQALSLKNEELLYLEMVTHWHPNEIFLNIMEEPYTLPADPSAWPALNNLSQTIMLLDAITYLTDDILVKVDRASMSNSLEVRCPILDSRVIEYSWRLPLSFKINNGRSKWLLRNILYKYVPSEIIERPKMGFGIPVDEWLRGPLREWAEELLSENKLKQSGLFSPHPIRKKWNEHIGNQRNHQHLLWAILMFQMWNVS